MPLPKLWPASINKAWEYVVRGAKEGLSATEALRQYRSGGGAISNEYWYDAYNEAKDLAMLGEQIGELPDFYTVNEYLAIDSPFRWQQEWVMQMEVTGRDPETGEEISRWVTVESDTPLTKSEYQESAQASITANPGSSPFEIAGVIDWTFYHRTGYE